MQTLEEKILSRYYGQGKGHVATQKHFLDFGSRDGVDKALSRLTQKGKLKRIARGLYEYPRVDNLLGELSPDLDKVAKAMAGREGIRLQPTGAYAANLLHLSEQVPMKVVFLTDGSSKKAQIGHQIIELRNASPKRMQLAGRISGLVFEALREIGKEHIDDGIVERLKETLTSDQQVKLLKDLPNAPAWMHAIIRAVTSADLSQKQSRCASPLTLPPKSKRSGKMFSEEISNQIKATCLEFSVRQLYVFGSVAKGQATEESDVDLLVEFEREGTKGAFDQFMGFKERMEAILGRPVDLITGKRFRNPYFQQSVEEEKKLISAA
jgi:predicted nucleotidyltransferase